MNESLMGSQFAHYMAFKKIRSKTGLQYQITN